jgi:hypothetical protein
VLYKVDSRSRLLFSCNVMLYGDGSQLSAKNDRDKIKWADVHQRKQGSLYEQSKLTKVTDCPNIILRRLEFGQNFTSPAEPAVSYFEDQA